MKRRNIVREPLRRLASRIVDRVSERLRTSEAGLTTLEYVIGAGIILVVLAAGILAWNQGLVQKIGQLVTQLLSS
jgi:CHASE3 domain sensor protein